MPTTTETETSQSPKNYRVLAFYQYVELANPHQEVAEHRAFCQQHGIRGRLYISEEGINGQMSAHKDVVQSYIDWLQAKPAFQGMMIKQHEHHEHAFAKLIIKYRKQLVALDASPSLKQRGDYVSPKQWRELMESDQKPLLLDVRNHYEWQVGHFEGAIEPRCDTFREFQEYAENLKKQCNPEETPVMMCCTGGIRCEIFSAYLKERGFNKVYQLEGGIINYGQKEGSKHWLGKLYVFDDRMTVPLSDEETPVVGVCYTCGGATENYYNCANMDCNFLFLSCTPCLEKHKGCCSEECSCSPRLRPYHHQNPHKPFRKWYNYFKNRLDKAD